jgi:ribonuclease P/MRP protein subunit RPP40
VLGQIFRAFHFRDRFTFTNLYKQYVRPHLEFVVQAWSPWTLQDKDMLEKVQKRAVGMVSGLSGTNYKEKLKELGLTTLEERRHQADML